jgi:DeoR/GlpR family transcriptional regulator of sugar metabolism
MMFRDSSEPEMSKPANISNAERQGRLSRLVEQRRRVSVIEICEMFGVSVATARRDLDALAEDGRVQRVHGGAIVAPSAPPEGPVLERALQQADEKRRIGQAAAKLIEPRDAIFIGSGTTSLEVARNLPVEHELTVVTNSLLALNVLSERSDITLVCLGGILRRGEGSMIGHIAEQALKELRLHKVFLGVRALDIAAGVTNDYLPETMTDRQILAAGRQVILLADHTKCGLVSSGFLAPLSSVHTLVTDTRTPNDFVTQVQAAGVKVLRV